MRNSVIIECEFLFFGTITIHLFGCGQLGFSLLFFSIILIFSVHIIYNLSFIFLLISCIFWSSWWMSLIWWSARSSVSWHELRFYLRFRLLDVVLGRVRIIFANLYTSHWFWFYMIASYIILLLYFLNNRSLHLLNRHMRPLGRIGLNLPSIRINWPKRPQSNLRIRSALTIIVGWINWKLKWSGVLVASWQERILLNWCMTLLIVWSNPVDFAITEILSVIVVKCFRLCF